MLNISAARRANAKTLELNIAPLIDMVFILLIFFLVTTSFLKETGVDISRPTASTAVSKAKTTILIGLQRTIPSTLTEDRWMSGRSGPM